MHGKCIEVNTWYHPGIILVSLWYHPGITLIPYWYEGDVDGEIFQMQGRYTEAKPRCTCLASEKFPRQYLLLMKSTFRPNGWMTDKVVEWRIKGRIRWRRDFDIPLFTFIHFPPLSIFINFHPFLSNVICFHSFHHNMCFCKKCPLWTLKLFLL